MNLILSARESASELAHSKRYRVSWRVGNQSFGPGCEIMSDSSSNKRNRGMTLIDLLVVLAVIALMAALVLPALFKARNRDRRETCINNMKQVGLAFRIWEGDHGDRYPMAVPKANGGSAEFVTGPNAFRHFQVLSNQLVASKILLCPAEEFGWKDAAANWMAFNNSNLSYFVGVNANETNVNMMLAGDHNITNGLPVANGLLELTSDRPAGWTSKMHKKVGNIVLADGSVQQVGNGLLRLQIADPSVVGTNRVQMPVRGP